MAMAVRRPRRRRILKFLFLGLMLLRMGPLVVTHGLVCHSLLTRKLQLPEGLDYTGGLANTALTVIDAVPPWRVRVLGCTAHLDASTAHDPTSRSGL